LAIATTRMGSTRVTCKALSLGNGQWLEDVHFNAEPTGLGILTGKIASAAPPASGIDLWARFPTRDFGLSWAKRELTKDRPAMSGEYAEVTKAQSSELVDDFKAKYLQK
jgi:hypothetical protein